MANGVYDEFVYHWTSAVRGMTPTGTTVNANTNYDGVISMHEAFVYAENNDTRNETPQYSSMPLALGNTLPLASYTKVAISGLAELCSTNNYSITNLPEGAAVSWQVSPDYSSDGLSVVQDNPSTNQCTLSRTSAFYMEATLTATILYGTDTLTTLTKTIYGHDDMSQAYVNYFIPGVGSPRKRIYAQNEMAIPAMTVISLRSDFFKGLTPHVIISRTSPMAFVNKVANDELQVRIMDGGYITFRMGEGECNSFEMFFYDSNSLYNLSITSSNRIHTVSLLPEATADSLLVDGKLWQMQDNNITNWTLEVSNVLTGEKMLSREVSHVETTFDSADWPSGIYALAATIKGKTITRKIIIK